MILSQRTTWFSLFCLVWNSATTKTKTSLTFQWKAGVKSETSSVVEIGVEELELCGGDGGVASLVAVAHLR